MSDEPNKKGTCSTFTNAPPSPAIELETLQAHAEVAQQYFLDTFKGVPIRVDENLEGNEYYCAVSQETYGVLRR